MKDHIREDKSRTGSFNRDLNRTDFSSSDSKTGKGGNNPYLGRLSDLKDYKVASDDPDVRGWDVISGDNDVIGKVAELIVDTKRMKVRYLVVEPKDDLGVRGVDDKFFVPIGAARLHEKNNDVIVSSLRLESLTSYPTFEGESISRDQEHSIRRFYEVGGTNTADRPTTSYSKSIMDHETIRDAHTGKTYARQDRESDRQDRDGVRGVDSNSRNRVDVVTGTSGVDKSFGSGQISDTPEENRMGDRSLADSNTISSSGSLSDRRPDGNTPFGSSNFTSSADIKDRVTTSGIPSNRTANLPNKDLEEGPKSGSPTADFSEEGRVRIHDTDPDVDAPKTTGRSDFNQTNDLNRSTSLGNDFKRGSNLGNLEDKKYDSDADDQRSISSPENRERSSMPGSGRPSERYPEDRKPVTRKDLEHHSSELPDDRYDPEADDFYSHDHFDEESFYRSRRNREE